jgi:hypothetical protein
MVLRAIRTYLAIHRRATLADLGCRFGIEDSALRGMLAVWEQKSLVRITTADSRPCGSCCACPPATEVCEWIGVDRS